MTSVGTPSTKPKTTAGYLKIYCYCKQPIPHRMTITETTWDDRKKSTRSYLGPVTCRRCHHEIEHPQQDSGKTPQEDSHG